MDCEELARISASVGEVSGWDFSRMRDERDPVPWDYEEVVRRYLRPDDRVLDIGTAGGERFLEFSAHFGEGTGIDKYPEMLRVARRNAERHPTSSVSFELMDAASLRFPEESFDVVLNRHAPVHALHVSEVVRVLRSGGVFITQQVGRRNAENICAVFGFDPTVEWPEDFHDVHLRADAFSRAGCEVVAHGEYDVGYRFLDVESLVFWIKSVPLGIEFDAERHWRQVAEIISKFGTPRGIETNEHRELLVVKRP